MDSENKMQMKQDFIERVQDGQIDDIHTILKDMGNDIKNLWKAIHTIQEQQIEMRKIVYYDLEQIGKEIKIQKLILDKLMEVRKILEKKYEKNLTIINIIAYGFFSALTVFIYDVNTLKFMCIVFGIIVVINYISILNKL